MLTIHSDIQVMNLINAVQESSSLTVSQALEKVVEILRTSELYAPRLPQQIARDSDPMTNDLVEGLVVVGACLHK